jgi:hypothetical protein
MRNRPLEDDVCGSDVAANRRYLTYLWAQLEGTKKVIEDSRQCVAETVAMVAQIDRILEKNRFSSHATSNGPAETPAP